MPNQFDENDIEEILYLKYRPDGGFDIVPKAQATVVKIILKDGKVIWAFPTQV